MVVAPLLSAVILLSMMGRGLPMRLPCAVVDLDHTEVSRSVLTTLDALHYAEIKSKYNSYSEALDAVQRGEVFGFFVIPEHFADDALAGRSPQISLYSNYVYYIPATMLYKGFVTTATLAKGGLVKGKLEAMGASEYTITPRLVPIANHVHQIGNPWMSYNIYLGNSFIPCVLALMVLLVTAYSILIEIKHYTSIEWLTTAGNSMTVALVGKLLTHTLVFFVVGVLIDILMYDIYGFPVNCSPWIVLLNTLLLVIGSQAFAAFVAMVIPNLRFAVSICALLGILSFSTCGFSFPCEQMYGAVEPFAWLMPMRYYFMIYIDQVLNGIDLYYSRYYFAMLIGFVLLPFTFGWYLKRKCLNPVYIE